MNSILVVQRAECQFLSFKISSKEPFVRASQIVLLLIFLVSTRQHEGDITRIILIEADGTIASAAKDKEMKFWYPPEAWKKEETPYEPEPEIKE
jgi:hypothetical protein